MIPAPYELRNRARDVATIATAEADLIQAGLDGGGLPDWIAMLKRVTGLFEALNAENDAARVKP